ncbi:MAG: Rnase Y domain-containing protein, partial [Nitrospiraceae bacterium]
MNTILTDVAVYVVAGILGAMVGIAMNEVLRRRSLGSRRSQAEEQARALVQGAERETDNLLREAKLEAKDLLLQARTELEKEQKDKRSELGSQEHRVLQREETLERKMGAAEKRDQALAKREETLAAKEAASEQAIKAHRQALERITGLTVEEAKRQLVSEIEGEARLEAAGVARRIVDEARENAEREAREIIARSIQRVTRDYVSEATISVVPIPNDAMKGRIIGREGRNIRAIEAATGIDLIIDETPEAVVISGFDPLRREVAKVSLERLMHDGRIHPTRIEEIVEKVKTDIDKLMVEEAEKVIYEVG